MKSANGFFSPVTNKSWGVFQRENGCCTAKFHSSVCETRTALPSYMTLFLLLLLLLVVVCCLLFGVFCLLFFVCCWLFVVGCLLLVVCFLCFPKEMYGFHIGATLFDYHRVSGWWEFV